MRWRTGKKWGGGGGGGGGEEEEEGRRRRGKGENGGVEEEEEEIDKAEEQIWKKKKTRKDMQIRHWKWERGDDGTAQSQLTVGVYFTDHVLEFLFCRWLSKGFHHISQLPHTDSVAVILIEQFKDFLVFYQIRKSFYNLESASRAEGKIINLITANCDLTFNLVFGKLVSLKKKKKKNLYILILISFKIYIYIFFQKSLVPRLSDDVIGRGWTGSLPNTRYKIPAVFLTMAANAGAIWIWQQRQC